MTQAHDNLDRAFFVSLIIKGVYGVFQLGGGILLLLLGPEKINVKLQALTAPALPGDYDDTLFQAIIHSLGHVNGGTIRFAAIYLIVDALIKLVLINEIFHKRYWAYLGLIAVLSLLAIYQSYKIAIEHSLFLTGLTIFDVIVIYLSAKEYRRHRGPQMNISPDTSG